MLSMVIEQKWCKTMEQEQPPEQKPKRNLSHFFDKRWKPLMLLSLLVLVASAGFLFYNQLSTGSFVNLNVELTGGKQIDIQLQKQPDMQKVREVLPDADIDLSPGITPSLTIQLSPGADENEVIQKLASIGVSGETSLRTFGPFLGEIFWRQAQLAIVAAFIVMAIVVFIIFRTFVPSVAIVLAAITDMAFALAVLNFMGVEFSLATLAGALMLIGYSVDTDIVLTAEMLKSKHLSVNERVHKAARTGLMLTVTALAALGAMYFTSGSLVIQQIVLVLIIGLIADLPATWLGNVGILRWHLARKERKQADG